MSFAKKSFALFRRDVFVYITRIITGAIIARSLGPAAMGLWIILTMIPAYAEAFGRLKFDIAAVYFLGQGKYKLGEVTFILNILGLLSGALIGLIFLLNAKFFNVFLFKGALEARYLFFLMLFSILSRFLSVNYSYLLIHLEDVKSYNFLILCQQFVSSLLAIVLLLIFHLGVAAMVFATLFGDLIAILYAAWVIQKSERMTVNFNINMIKDFFNYSYNIYFAGLVSQLNTYVASLLVAFYMLPIQVAFFRMGQDKAMLLHRIPSAINTILYPRISKSEEGTGQSADLSVLCYRISCILMSIGAVIGVFLIKPVIFLLYGKDFIPLSVSFWILLPGLVFSGAASVFTQYFLGIGRPRITLYISFIPLVCQIIMGIILIPIFGIIGAAFTVSLTLMAVSLITILVFAKIAKVSFWQIVLPKQTDFIIIFDFIKGQFMSLTQKVAIRKVEAVPLPAGEDSIISTKEEVGKFYE